MRRMVVEVKARVARRVRARMSVVRERDTWEVGVR